jgi:hypothetical protein
MTLTESELLGRLERQAGELAVLRERFSSQAAALSAERKQRAQLEQLLAEARQAQARLDEAVASARRERTARRDVEEELVRANEEIEALRMEVDHAWTRLQSLRDTPQQQPRWRRRRGQATD